MALQQTRAAVRRYVVRFRIDEFGCRVLEETSLVIAVARCPACEHRLRILPACLLPRKRYSLDALEQATAIYLGGGLSLRHVAWKEFGGATFSHTTLHAWTEGLGSWALGRKVGRIRDSATVGQVATEVESRFPAARGLRRQAIYVDPRRYRSEGRRERLQACRWLMLLSAAISGRESLVELNSSFVAWTGSCHGLGFRTGHADTSTEHLVSQEHAQSPRNPDSRGEDKWPTRGR